MKEGTFYNTIQSYSEALNGIKLRAASYFCPPFRIHEQIITSILIYLHSDNVWLKVL